MAKNINDTFGGATQPKSREISAAKPPMEVTTMSGGEPEKDFTRPLVKPQPKPRPLPEDAPKVTTMGGGEPEKQFGRLITPDFD